MPNCQNCGAIIESNQKVCSLCGYNLGEKEPDNDMDAKITEMIPHIFHLQKEMRKQIKEERRAASYPWIIIVPIAFFIIFFGSIFFLISISQR